MTQTPSPAANGEPPDYGASGGFPAEVTALDEGGQNATASPSSIQKTHMLKTFGVMLAALALVMAAFYIPMPYVVNQPGPTFDVIGANGDTPMIDITDPQSGHLDLDPVPVPNDGTGQLRMVTVAQIGGPGNRLHFVDWLLVRFDSTKEILRYSDVYPTDVTRKDVEEQQAAQMSSSQSTATSVALESLGMKVPATIEVVGAVAGTSADGKFEDGDILKSLTTPDGVVHEATSADVPFATMRTVPPDSKVTATVERAGKAVPVELTTNAVPGEPGASKLGVYLVADVDAPLDIKIHLEKVGGPSAGMIFALGIVDRLTPGDMTGGKVIAGTGSLSFDGRVEPIGGIRQKLWGAKDDGAEWFLAPVGNCDEVLGNVPDGLNVVKVKTFQDARDAVDAIAAGNGSTLAQCTEADVPQSGK